MPGVEVTEQDLPSALPLTPSGAPAAGWRAGPEGAGAGPCSASLCIAGHLGS